MRRLPFLFIAVCTVLLALSTGLRARRLLRGWPAVSLPAAERAALESGDPRYHAFLAAVGAALRPGEAAAIWVEDPSGETSFVTYRARAELFPSRVFVFAGPRRGATVPAGVAVVGEYRRGAAAGKVRRT